MGEVKIHNAETVQAKSAAKALERSIEAAYRDCGTLIARVESAKWSGKSRDTFLSYMELIEQYHKELVSIVKLQTKALDNLEGYKKDFLQDSAVSEVKNL